jgi:aryl-alcohol dehydrogenase-like predicted oxidoreductase
MDTIELGRSGLKVTPICFGTWEFSGEWGPVDHRAAASTVRAARDAGINFFDTAQAYGFGVAERVLGDALGRELHAHREEVVIATKGGLRRTDGRLVRDSSPTWLRRGVEDSLRALDIDVIDLYQLHWPDPTTPIEDTVAALRRLADEGKIRHIGVSNFDVEQMESMAGYGLPETLQPPYHMFRRSIEAAVLPYCRANDIGVCAYGALAHGLLSGAMNREPAFDPGDWRASSPDFAGRTLQRNLDVVEQLRDVASQRGASLPQLSVAWALARSGVDSVIVGARSPAHLLDTVAAVHLQLADDELVAIDRVLESAAPVDGPTPEGQPER